MAKRLALSKLEAKAFHKVHRALKKGRYCEYWLKGGRGSTKSSFISLEIVLGMLRDREASAIVYRKVAAQMRNSVYAQMKWAIEALGASDCFRFYKSPLEMECLKTGQRILFRGADDPGKSKSLKLEKGYFKYLWFEELTEFEGMDDIRTIKISVFRQRGEAVTFYSYNPPKSAQNWVNAEALLNVPGRMVHHSDYTQVPREWLGEAFLNEAAHLKSVNESAYRNIYLGAVTGSGGQVFDNVAVREITAKERAGFDTFLNGGDFGFASDPDAFVRMHYEKRTHTLYIVAEVYGARMTGELLHQRVKEMIGREAVVCDSAEPRMIDELKRRGLNARAAKKGPGSIEHGIRWLQDLGAIVIDKDRCPNAAREFMCYEYRRGQRGELLPCYQDRDNHTIDAARYGVEALSLRRAMKIMNKSDFGF